MSREWRTNRKTHTRFRMGTATAKMPGFRDVEMDGSTMHMPNETAWFMQKAWECGLEPVIEMRYVDEIVPRGLREVESEAESDTRMKYIMDHINTIAYPVICEYDQFKVADGNHRVGVMKAMWGHRKIPVLVVYGHGEDKANKFEDIIQKYNSTATFAGREFGTLG